MRRRTEGNTIIVEDDNGDRALTARVDGLTATLEYGDWTMVKAMGEDPGDALGRVAGGSVQSTRFRFFDTVIELRSNVSLITDDLSAVYSRFIDAGSSPPDLTIHAMAGYPDLENRFLLVMQPAPDRTYRLKGDFCAVSYLRRLEYLLLQAHIEVEVFVLTNNRRSMFIHGGAVSRDGIGYMMPAESGSGKTTLTLALLLAGYRFYSDEFAVLDAVNRTMMPYPRSLSIRADSLQLFPDLYRRRAEFPLLWSPKETLYSVDIAGISASGIEETCPVGFVIFPHYEPSERPSMREISRGEAVRRLVGTKSYLSLGTTDKQQALDILISMLSGAQCYDLTTGDLSYTVELVNGLRH